MAGRGTIRYPSVVAHDDHATPLGDPHVLDQAVSTTSAAFMAKVQEVIEIIRPVIQADKGDILLIDVDETSGVVSVELVGACASCPASTQTLKAGVERIMKDRVPGVTEVINVADARYEGTPLSL